MQEMWVRSLGREDPLEEEMEIHCSILDLKIPWTEEGHKDSDASEHTCTQDGIYLSLLKLGNHCSC